MHVAVSLIPVAMAPLSRIIAKASAVPTMARIITYSAAAAPLSSSQKRAKDLAVFLIANPPKPIVMLLGHHCMRPLDLPRSGLV